MSGRRNVREIDVVVSGHLCMDMFPDMDTIPRAALALAGTLLETGPLAISTGGAVSNVGRALHRLGLDVRLVAAVGDDLIGRATAQLLGEQDPALNRHIRFRSGAPSSYTIALSPQRTDRTFLHYPGVNGTFGAADIEFNLLREARFFYLGYPSILPKLMEDDGAELETIFAASYKTGAVTALDMSLPDPAGPGGRVDWHKLIARTLPFVDVFVPSIEEILFMLRRADYDAWRGAVVPHLTRAYLRSLADELLAMGAAVVGFKLGEFGMVLYTANDAARFARFATLDSAAWAGQEVYHPAFAVTVAGTTGAGDCAYAGLLAALRHGLSPAGAVEFACGVGACNVEAPDASSGVRSWEATRARIAAGWPLRTETLT